MVSIKLVVEIALMKRKTSLAKWSQPMQKDITIIGHINLKLPNSLAHITFIKLSMRIVTFIKLQLMTNLDTDIINTISMLPNGENIIIRGITVELSGGLKVGEIQTMCR